MPTSTGSRLLPAGKKRVLFYARPETERRGTELGILALSLVAKKKKKRPDPPRNMPSKSARNVQKKSKVGAADRTPVLITYHPAYLLRSPGEKAKSWADLKRVHQFLHAD